jgi:hypothetical protein
MGWVAGGGEEFVLVCPGANLARAADLAEKLRHKIMDTNFIPEDPLPITASFGVATSGADQSFEDAFRQADQALYLAKSRGRNCVVAANEDQMHKVTGARKSTWALISGASSCTSNPRGWRVPYPARASSIPGVTIRTTRSLFLLLLLPVRLCQAPIDIDADFSRARTRVSRNASTRADLDVRRSARRIRRASRPLSRRRLDAASNAAASSRRSRTPMT